MILSIAIFSMFIYGTLLFGEFRLAFAFGGIALLMGCNLITVERFTQSASLDVLVFLIGTFLVIGFLEESQFFEHVVSAIVGFIGPKPQRCCSSLMMMAAISSALVGEVTAILFMAGAMLHLTNKYRLNPVPFIIMLVFACNNGSAMSSVGNPIGVLIALKTGLSFVDFLMLGRAGGDCRERCDVLDLPLVVCRRVRGICRGGASRNSQCAPRAAHRRAAMARPSAHGGRSTGNSDDSSSEYVRAESEELRCLSTEFYNAADADTIDDLSAQGTFRLCWVILGWTGRRCSSRIA